jgi:hypothetical protein
LSPLLSILGRTNFLISPCDPTLPETKERSVNGVLAAEIFTVATKEVKERHRLLETLRQ